MHDIIFFMGILNVKKVISFILVESEVNENVNSRFMVNAGYKLIDTVNYNGKIKTIFAWDSEYGVYLYWDEDFISNMQSLSRRFTVSGLMWDSLTGLRWFNSEDSPVYGLFNINSIIDDDIKDIQLAHISNVLSRINDEEQSLLCLGLPWMAGFFSNIQMLLNSSNGYKGL